MKRVGAIILLIALCLFLAASALAESGPVARSGEIAVYTDGDGHLYLPGKAEAINQQTADGIVAVDAYRVLFFCPDSFLGTNDLYMIDLQSFEESLVARDVHAACLANEDTAYYVPAGERTQLMRVALKDMTTSLAYTATEPIDRLYVSVEGLLFQLVDQAGTYIYLEAADRFDLYTDALPRSGMLTESYELYLNDAGNLYLKNDFNYTSALIDSDVTAFTRMNGAIYYLTRSGSTLRLKTYDTSTRKSRVVLTPAVAMTDQLTASDRKLFLLGTNNDVCVVDTAKGTLGLFKRYGDLSAYPVPEGYTASGLRIEAMGGQLNVYAVLKEKLSKPDFSFIEFETESEVAEPVLRLIETLPIASEQTAWDVLKPAPQYTPLARGSRGDAVRAIQQPLYDLGYYDYYVDGIFGPRTQYAVKLLQSDLERPVTGIADAELQKIILSGRLSTYDPYRPLARGARGLRVQIMQQRLRDLGYLADAADGMFGPRTQKAVQLFQSENGLAVNDGATRETLKRLYSDAANRCSSYIDLYPGDTGCRVRELNNRLMELYYLDSNPGSSYTSQTASAVRVFQRMVGMRETGIATQAMLRRLFAPDAPEAPGYIVLRRGDENERVERLQRRLKELNYYHGKVNGYFGKQTRDAVALFQRVVGLRPTGVATVRTQQLLFSPDAPYYVPPTELGIPEIDLDTFDRIENDIYFISDDSTASGYITFTWDCEGDVDYYNVRIVDANSDVYVDNDTQMTRTGVSLTTLDTDVVYTIQVTAYPMDGDDDHITEAELSFVRTEEEAEPEVGAVSNPTITVDTVARMEGDVYYLVPGTVDLFWYADGDVEGYYVEIRDEADAVTLSLNTSDMDLSFSSDTLTPGEVYTVCVYAIPENGTLDDASMRFISISLPEIELPPADPTPEPEPLPEPDPTPEPQIEPALPEDVEPEATPEAIPTFEPEPEPEPEVTQEPVPEAPEEQPAPEEPTPEKPAPEEPTPEEPVPEEPTPEEPVPEEPTPEEPVPEEPTPEEPVPEEPAPEEPVPEEPTPEQPTPEIAAPVPSISFDSVSAVEADVNYIDSDIIVMRWSAEGDVDSYYVEVLDAAGNVLATAATAESSLSADAKNMVPGEVYTLRVTAIPVGGSLENGIASTALFALYVAPESAPVDVEPAPDDVEPQYDDVEPQYDDVEPQYDDVEPAPDDVEPAPAYVGAPVLGFDNVVSTDGDISYVAAGIIGMNWYAEGDVSSYYIEILDESGAPIAATETTESALSSDSNNLAVGAVYTLRVTAIPVGGTLETGSVSAARFSIYAEPEPDYADSETNGEAQIDDAPAYDGDQEPEGEPEVESPVEEAATAYVGTPALSFDTVVSTDGDITYVASGIITMSWYAEGDVTGYYVEVLDQNGSPIAGVDTDKTSLSADSGNLAAGEVYTLRVTAIPAGGSIENGAVGAARFCIYVEPESEYQEPEYQEPEYQEPEYQEPEYQEPEYQEPEYQEPEYQEPEYQEPEYQEPEYQEPEYQEPEYDSGNDEDYDDDTSGAPSLTEDEIAKLQQRLVSWGWMSEGAYTAGVLDEVTVRAIAQFQQYCNEQLSMTLPAINPSDPSVDADTYALLTNDNGQAYPNPAVSSPENVESYDGGDSDDFEQEYDYGEDSYYEEVEDDLGDGDYEDY